MIGNILAANIRWRMADVYREHHTETDRIEALASATGIAKETVRRILIREVSPRLDNVQMIAIALGATAAELLEPSKGAENEQELREIRRG